MAAGAGHMAFAAALDVTVDAAATFVLAVTNDGKEPVSLTFPDARRVEVVVRADGEERWRSGEGRMFAQVVGTETVAPGDSRSFEVAWEDPAPGAYEAVATLAARGIDLSASASFEVEG